MPRISDRLLSEAEAFSVRLAHDLASDPSKAPEWLGDAVTLEETKEELKRMWDQHGPTLAAESTAWVFSLLRARIESPEEIDVSDMDAEELVGMFEGVADRVEAENMALARRKALAEDLMAEGWTLATGLFTLALQLALTKATEAL